MFTHSKKKVKILKEAYYRQSLGPHPTRKGNIEQIQLWDSNKDTLTYETANPSYQERRQINGRITEQIYEMNQQEQVEENTRL
ncbi:hypothetical protein Tco_0952465 [Tanacetum coccineum]|uniref:Uncharacterized protein n=1 Tax=Tanacetum coccineum TaxID=301880 RepID=A0ABQ5DXG4_9ASTR